MAAVDSTVTNLGFGTIAGGLNVSIDEVAWISTSYVVAMVVAMPLAGWLAANVGRKRSLIAALTLFTAASFLCAISTSLATLTIARFIQGFGAGAMQPLATAALMDEYPRDDLPTAFKIIGFGGMVGPLMGPVLGGIILDNFTWPAIFLINVPVGLLTILLALSVLRDHNESGERSRFDWTSLALMSAGLVALQYVLTEGPRADWFASGAVVAVTATCVVALGTFVWIQLTSKAPLVDLRPFRGASFSAGILLSVVTGIGFTGTAFTVPLYFEQILGFDPTAAGLGIIPNGIALIFGIQIATWLIGKRISPVLIAAVGLVLLGAGTMWFALLGKDVGFAQIVPPRLVQGLGNGLTYIPLNVLIMRNVPKRLYDAASGLSGVARQIGVAVGYAVLTAVLVRAQTAANTDIFNAIHLGPARAAQALVPIQQWLIAHGYSAYDAQNDATPLLQQFVAHDAALAGFNQTFYIIALLFVGTLPLLAIFWRRAAAETDA